MRDICGILGINRSSFYYQPREDRSEAVLRAEWTLAGRYPRYGYRRINITPASGIHVKTRRSVDGKMSPLFKPQNRFGETLDQARNP